LGLTKSDRLIWQNKAWIARYTSLRPKDIDEMELGQFVVFTNMLKELIKAENNPKGSSDDVG